jgi:hypothetical protein
VALHYRLVPAIQSNISKSPSLKRVAGVRHVSFVSQKSGSTVSPVEIPSSTSNSRQFKQSLSRWYPPHTVAANIHSQYPQRTPRAAVSIYSQRSCNISLRTAGQTCSASNPDGLLRVAVLHVWPVSPVPVSQASRRFFCPVGPIVRSGHFVVSIVVSRSSQRFAERYPYSYSTTASQKFLLEAPMNWGAALSHRARLVRSCQALPLSCNPPHIPTNPIPIGSSGGLSGPRREAGGLWELSECHTVGCPLCCVG